MPDISLRFQIKNRFTGNLQFEAEIEATADMPYGIKLGLAIKAALKASADLSSANLSSANLYGADLSSANLYGADLSSANLSSANLYGADLYGAYLRAFKVDIWATLTENRNEVPGLINAIREGRIDGSQYSGECACLVGTLANVRGISYSDLSHSSDNPGERWFLMIRKGDKPGDESGGSFAAKMALDWCLEWCALNGVNVSDGLPVEVTE